jgi:hypothetical protein
MFLDQLASSVERRSAAKCLPAAQQHHPALLPFATVDAVLEYLALRPAESVEFARRDEVVHALVSEYQRTTGVAQQLWSSVLLQAFTPLIHLLAGKVRKYVNSKSERVGRTVEAFMVGLGRVDCTVPAPFIPLRLRSKTWQALIQGVKSQVQYEMRAEPMCEEELELELLDRGAFDRGPRFFQDQLLASAPQLRQLLFHWLGASFPADQLDLIADTVLSGREITEYVRERISPLSPRETRRVEGNVRQRRNRALREVRTELRARMARDVSLTRRLPQVGR